MKDTRQAATSATKGDGAHEPKKKTRYAKPSFEHERIFETMALACGKVSHTQAQCRFNRKNS
jgi:hypothetical protein